MNCFHLPISSRDATVRFIYTATEHEITNCNYKLEEKQKDKNEKKRRKEINKCMKYYPAGINLYAGLTLGSTSFHSGWSRIFFKASGTNREVVTL